MNIKYTEYFKQKLSKKLQKNSQLRDRVKRQIKLLTQDIRHPGLKVHKLQGKRAIQYAFWVEKNIRITFLIQGDYFLLTDIITHDEYR